MSDQPKDILYPAASQWKKLTEYSYVFTYGYKKELYTINLIFGMEDFPHLAGFQYLDDLSLPRYNSGKIVDKILDNTITFEQISKGQKYQDFVKPRLETLIETQDIIESDFTFYSFMPGMYPFTTMIKANYLITSHMGKIYYIFIIKEDEKDSTKCEYKCCSAFTKDYRDYETNQRERVILKKERIHLPTGTKIVLYDRLTNNSNKE